MADERDNPRAIRETQARYAYDVRNHGVDKAVDNVFARNAARRESERRAAQRAVRDELENRMDKEMRRLERNPKHFT